jgi:hypothetical protein
LDKTPRSQWEARAAELSAQLAGLQVRGFSKKRILDLYRSYRAEGINALLLNYGSKSEKPAEFLGYLGTKVENNNRVSSVALREIQAEWRSGKDIPGFGSWRTAWAKAHPGDALPAYCPDWFLPSGFSKRNLYNLIPAEAQLSYARNGCFASHSLMPQKRNDYRSLRPLEIIVFDDVRCDWQIYYPGADKACEMWMLVAMDAATRQVLDWVTLARVPDDAGKRAELLGEHMLILVGSIFRQYGVPRDYTMTLKVENAKATINQEKAQYLGAMAGGQIAVDYTVMHNRRLPNGHTERHGTPWDIKGILESFFGNFHNHAAGYIGQTGASYDLAPADLKSRQDELKSLLKEAEGLPAELIDQLRLPFMRYEEACAVVEKIMRLLNNRTEHTLQGFDKVDLFRLPGDLDWRPLDELRRLPRETVRTATFERRLESPAQRFGKLVKQVSFTPVPDDALIPLMAQTVKRVRHPAPGTIEWSVDGVVWSYRAELSELDGKREGKDFFVRFLPANVNAAWLFDAESGRQLGVMQRINIPRINDKKAQMQAVGEVVHARSLVTKPVDERHAGERLQREADQQLNAALIAAAKSGREMVAQSETATKTTRKQTAATQARRENLAAELAAASREREAFAQDQDAPAKGRGLYD